MRSANIAGGETIFSGDINGLRGDAQGSATLSAHQMLGSLAAATNPTDGQTLTLTVNGTAIVVRFKNTIAAANDVKIQGSATLTAAALYTFLTNPQLTTANQIAATAANQALLSYLWFNNVTTTTYIGSMNKTVNSQLTSFSVSTTVTSAVWTGNTMKLFVQGGTVMVAGTQVKYAGGMTPAVTAPSANPRIDVLTIDNAGTLAWTTGAENASPVVPTYPINKVPIIEIWNVVGETIIEDNDNQVSGQGFINFDVRPMVGTAFNPGSIGASLIPDADGTRDLGSLSLEWNNIYAKTAIFVGGVGVAIAKFGGIGTDGALTITSGTTTLACGSAFYLVKNYTSISITSTAVLTVSGVSNNGTILVLKAQGAVTLTGSATPMINLAGFGAQPSSRQPISTLVPFPTAAGGGQGAGGATANQFGGVGGIAGVADIETIIQVGKMIPIMCGGSGGQGTFNGFFNSSYTAGGGGGGGTAVILYNFVGTNTGTFVIAGGNGGQSTGTSNNAPPGGAGGGALYLECGGTLNFSGQISIAGLGGTGNNNVVGGGDAGGNARGTGSGTGGKPQDNLSSTASTAAGGGSGGLSAANGSGGTNNGAGGASGTYYIGKNNGFA